MNVLFWTTSFPNYSETFISNQIVNLIDSNINVLIYANSKNTDQLQTVRQLESYNLLERTTFKEKLFPRNKFLRISKALFIILKSLFSNDYKYYRKALNVSKYGYASKSLKRFYFVHYLMKNKIDIVHAHFGPNGKEASIYKEIGLPIKLICTFHGYDIRLGESKPKDFYSDLFEYVDKIISISKYNYDKLVEFGLEKKKIAKINNGIDINQFKQNAKKDFRTIKILSVGRLVEDKAFHFAFKALSRFHENFPNINWEYEIIGAGKLENELKKLVEELDFSDKVKFHLYQNSEFVIELMNNSHFLLLTSINEALPTVILEAQAMSLPIVATNVGSVNSLVINNETGFLVSPNLESIYSGILKMIENKDRWVYYGNNGRKMIERDYYAKSENLKLIDLYKTCLNG
jgi:colanic acid/amylovoran biosynthesis glycosyltransferase